MYYLQTDKTVKTASIFITYVLLTQDSQDRETVKTINTVKTKSVFITYALLTQDRETVKTASVIFKNLCILSHRRDRHTLPHRAAFMK